MNNEQLTETSVIPHKKHIKYNPTYKCIEPKYRVCAKNRVVQKFGQAEVQWSEEKLSV